MISLNHIKSKKSRRPGFTLVELLTVIAIIGILAGLLFPTIGEVLKDAKKTVSLNNLGQIAKSHYTIAMASARPKVIGIDRTGTNVRNTNEWAIDLAKKGGVNQSIMYFTGNFQPATEIHELIYNSIKKIPNGDFKTSRKLAYDVVSGMRSSVRNPSATTLIWTTDGGTIFQGGDWNEGSPWEGSGGHIAYIDGHVAYFDNTDGDGDGMLTNYKTGDPTADPGLANPSRIPGADEKVLGPLRN